MTQKSKRRKRKMENEKFIDVTEEADVSDAILEHEENPEPAKNLNTVLSSALMDNNDNTIKIHSVSANTYLMDRTTVDWEQTSLPENLQKIYNNKDYIYRVLRDLMFTRNVDAEDMKKFATDQAMNFVKPFVEEFGIRPNYKMTYPDAAEIDVAMCYCFDAIIILMTILTEIAVYRATHPVTASEVDVENIETHEEEQS
jgi:hypothetical protein